MLDALDARRVVPALGARLSANTRSEGSLTELVTFGRTNMSRRRRLLWLTLIFLLVLSHAEAQEGVTQQPPPKYRMELVYIFETDSPEFIFVVGSAGFKSVASLK